MVQDTSEAPLLTVLSDTPNPKADLLQLQPCADALSLLIDQKATTTPLVVAISAPWGSGKTTVAGLVEAQLRKCVDWNEPHATCWFNAWENDDSANLGRLSPRRSLFRLTTTAAGGSAF